MSNKKEYVNTAKRLQQKDIILQIKYLVQNENFENAYKLMLLHQLHIDALELNSPENFKIFINSQCKN